MRYAGRYAESRCGRRTGSDSSTDRGTDRGQRYTGDNRTNVSVLLKMMPMRGHGARGGRESAGRSAQALRAAPADKAPDQKKKVDYVERVAGSARADLARAADG